MIAAQEKEGGINTVYRLQAKGGIEVFQIQFPQGAVVDPQQVRCLDNRMHLPPLADRPKLPGSIRSSEHKETSYSSLSVLLQIYFTPI